MKPALRHNILTTRLYNPQGQRIDSGELWELADGQLQALLSRYEVDLSLAIDELNKLLPDILNRRTAQQISRIAESLRLVTITVEADGIDVAIRLLTATNALDTLDRLGPSFGLDISADGLRRMGRMLIDQPGIDPLRYEDAVVPELRRLFRLPALPASSEPSGFNFTLWPIRSAWANKADGRLNRWVPNKSELPEYLPMIRDLLKDSAKNTAKGKLDSPTAKLYQHLVLTTAWQESCWRQYVIEQGRIVPLRSSTGDSGLMQINERVWRGFYETQKLRWDISYNALAGAEVLLQYLVKNALKRGEQKHQGGKVNLARAAYSAYNGGPGQISRYRNPQAASAHKKIDAAFWKKYQAVKQDTYQ